MTTTVFGPGDPAPQAEEREPLRYKAAPVEEPQEMPDGSVITVGEVLPFEEPENDIQGIDPQTGEVLFDDSVYRLEAPTFDNLASDKLILSLGGPIELDPTNPDDLALFENFMLGKGVSLLVHGTVVGKLGSYKENADGEVTVTGKAAVKVHSLTLQNG